MVYAPAPVAPDVSRTALAMCAYCAFTRRHERFASVFSDAYSEALFRRAAVDGGRILDQLGCWTDVERYIQEEADGDLLILRHIVWRKRWVADQVAEALRQGVQQAVVFGAGFDTLALRLSEAFPKATFFEIDKAPLLSLKQRLVAEIASNPPDVRYIPLDLTREHAASALLESDYDPSKPALFLAEAVLEYLPPPEASSVFHFVSNYSARGSRFIFSFFSRDALDSRSRRALNAFAEVGEPILFTMSPVTLDSYLHEHGFDRCALLTPQFVREHYLNEIGMLGPDMTVEHVRDLLHFCVAKTRILATERKLRT